MLSRGAGRGVGKRSHDDLGQTMRIWLPWASRKALPTIPKEFASAVLQDGAVFEDTGGNALSLSALTTMPRSEFVSLFVRLAAQTPCTPDWQRDEFYRRETQKVNTSMRRATLVMAWLTAAITVLTVVNVVVVIYR
jgi:hypothetical protein